MKDHEICAELLCNLYMAVEFLTRLEPIEGKEEGEREGENSEKPNKLI